MILLFEVIWQDALLYTILAMTVVGILMMIPPDIWRFVMPFVMIALVVVAAISYIIWYLINFKFGWVDLSYLSVLGIDVGVVVTYFIIMSQIDKYKNRKHTALKINKLEKTFKKSDKKA